MTDAIKVGDFIQIEYTGYVAEDNAVFDTTDQALAKKHQIDGRNAKYGPVIICIGEHQLIKGVDDALIGKNAGAACTIALEPEQAFGKKNIKMLQLVPTQKFLKEGIRPMPGLQITVDNMLGLVKSVSGGRTMVDFNHPLAGRAIRYEVQVLKKITAAAEKLTAFVSRTMQLPEVKVTVTDGTATVEVPFDLPEELVGEYRKKVMAIIPEIKHLEFKKGALPPTTKNQDHQH